MNTEFFARHGYRLFLTAFRGPLGGLSKMGRWRYYSTVALAEADAERLIDGSSADIEMWNGKAWVR